MLIAAICYWQDGEIVCHSAIRLAGCYNMIDLCSTAISLLQYITLSLAFFEFPCRGLDAECRYLTYDWRIQASPLMVVLMHKGTVIVIMIRTNHIVHMPVKI